MLDDATKKQIYDAYQKGNSPQAIARSFRCSVEEVLVITDNAEMLYVETPGDMIDQEEAGDVPVNYNGTKQRPTYDIS